MLNLALANLFIISSILFCFKIDLIDWSTPSPPQSSTSINSSYCAVNRSLLVEIWSKSALGQYLWQNILAQNIEPTYSGNFYIEAFQTIGLVNFRFRSGPSLKLSSLSLFSVPNLILVVNWRNREKIDYSLKWIQALGSMRSIENVGLIALGDERCQNDWFLNQLKSVAKFRFLFIVYDWNKVDQKTIFQWPLGVASYRGFPSPSMDNVGKSRRYLCNFMATVYPNSSRQQLQKFFASSINDSRRLCLVRTRSTWKPNEDFHSMTTYVEALKSSELTLSPVGMNHECYRILEAVEYGSVPVVEQNLNSLRDTQCDRNSVLRIFQNFQAPFIYVTDWAKQLPLILERQGKMSEQEKLKQRIALIKWYHKFKIKLRNQLCNVVQDLFI